MRLDFDLVNRVRNVSLAESPSNALLPVFEAISNSIHAIENRFGPAGLGRGRIEVAIDVDRKQRVPVVKVVDNGVGLNRENWKSFTTSDSPHKLRRGGKGVGRLSWLKVFDYVDVESTYTQNNEFERIEFELHLDNDDPIRGFHRAKLKSAHRGTTVILHDMNDAFAAALPKKSSTVARRIAGHFLPYLLSEDRPKIELDMSDETTSVDQLVKDAIRKTRQQTISVDVDQKSESLDITHLVLHKSLRFSTKDHNWVFYGGNKRVAAQRPLDSQLGLHAIGEARDCFYVAYVTGRVLDRSVNAERTGFTIGEDSFSKIQNAVRDAAKRFLKDEIEGVRDAQKATVRRLIAEYPSLRMFEAEVDSFVGQKLSLNTRDRESVYLELQRHSLRRATALQKEVSAVKAAKGGIKAASLRIVRKVAEDLEVRAESALAEYVRWRHRVLSILSERIGQSDLTTGKYRNEEDIHELIAPLRIASNGLNVEDQNIWVIDDRMPLYNFVASDKQLRSVFSHLKSKKRPDILLYNEVFGFKSSAASDPIILVEFKRPGRKDYSKQDNPIAQIVDYVIELRRGAIDLTDGRGKQIPTLGADAWFQAYVIADLTANLKEVIDNHTFANSPSHGGYGRFGIHHEHKLIVQVLSYSLLLDQAIQRNKVLFEKLQLADIA